MKLLQILRRPAGLLSFLCGMLLIFVPVAAQATTTFFGFSVQQDVVRFTFPTNAASYYVLQGSTDLKTFAPLVIAYGSDGLSYEFPATGSAFFFAKGISIYQPQDSLNDGIDDVFKLNSGLNPLDPTVAGSASGRVDTNGVPLTWLQYYQQALSRDLAIGESYGREWSIFNHSHPIGFGPKSRIS